MTTSLRRFGRRAGQTGLGLLALLMLFFAVTMGVSGQLALGPEDEVSVLWWLMPLILGVGCFWAWNRLANKTVEARRQLRNSPDAKPTTRS